MTRALTLRPRQPIRRENARRVQNELISSQIVIFVLGIGQSALYPSRDRFVSSGFTHQVAQQGFRSEQSQTHVRRSRPVLQLHRSSEVQRTRPSVHQRKYDLSPEKTSANTRVESFVHLNWDKITRNTTQPTSPLVRGRTLE